MKCLNGGQEGGGECAYLCCTLQNTSRRKREKVSTIRGKLRKNLYRRKNLRYLNTRSRVPPNGGKPGSAAFYVCVSGEKKNDRCDRQCAGGGAGRRSGNGVQQKALHPLYHRAQQGVRRVRHRHGYQLSAADAEHARGDPGRRGGHGARPCAPGSPHAFRRHSP